LLDPSPALFASRLGAAFGFASAAFVAAVDFLARLPPAADLPAAPFSVSIASLTAVSSGS